MDNDFNTPLLLTVLFELAKEVRQEGNVFEPSGKDRNFAGIVAAKNG